MSLTLEKCILLAEDQLTELLKTFENIEERVNNSNNYSQ
jgi:hypothetical protein